MVQPPADNDRGPAILWLEADAVPSLLAMEYARKRGWKMTVVRTREEAREALSRMPFDIEVYVYRMGHEDPTPLVRFSRALYPGSSHVRILVKDDDSMVERIAAAREGFDLVFRRPSDPQHVINGALRVLSADQPPKPRVLLIEWDPFIRGSLVQTLTEGGMEVYTLEDTNLLLPTLEERMPDLLLLDRDQPMEDGLDLCRVIRGHITWRHLYVVYLTTRTGLEARLEALQAGADDCLVRPVHPDELLARLRQMLWRSREDSYVSPEEPL